MHYDKLIKLAVYFKSSGNNNVYLDLIKLAIASQGKFEALVMGSYPSGERKENGEYDYTIINEAKRKRDKVVELINNDEEENANIPALVNIINRINDFKVQDNLSIWREGLDPKHVQELQALLTQPSPSQDPPRNSYQNSYREQPRSSGRYSWNGMVASEISTRLYPLIQYHSEIVRSIQSILTAPISWTVRKESGFMSRFLSDENSSTYFGKIANYFPKDSRGKGPILRVLLDGSGGFAYVDITDPKVTLNQNYNQKINDSLDILKNASTFLVNIPRSGGQTSRGFIVDAYTLDDGTLEIVTQWPTGEGEERGRDMFVKRFNSSDGSLNGFLDINTSLFR